jgi:murein DD-endopeptidase MepM/ murein hydrolase activator NlpD
MGRRAIQIVVGLAAACMLAAPAGARPARHVLDFSWPAHGIVTTPFSSHHPGIDIAMLRSLSVTAAAPGKVEAVGFATGFEGYGNIVLVQVTPGVVTLYAHLSSYRVHVGQAVLRGELLGIAGCTGYCSGTHLHFEVRRDGVAVDPRRFLGG